MYLYIVYFIPTLIQMAKYDDITFLFDKKLLDYYNIKLL